jgi:xanthine dehydrogenase accessory factor
VPAGVSVGYSGAAYAPAVEPQRRPQIPAQRAMTAMSRSEVEILERGRQWLEEGERVVLATVAHTWGSSPRPPGALMVLGESGRFAGSVSGGCIEEELIERVRADFPQRFETIEYASESHRALPCGGRLLLALEPLDQVPRMPEMLAALRAGTAVARTLDLDRREASWRLAERGARTRLADQRLEVIYEPAWRMVVVGAGELAHWVCRFAALLDYALEVCDPRGEYRDAWRLPDVAVHGDYPDDYLGAHACDANTAVVALTHDPKIDDLAVMEALRTPAFYIGALGSSRSTQKRIQRLTEHFGATPADIGRIRGPIGIDLNTRKPQEIALAVLTEVTAARNGVAVTTQRLDPGA